MKVPIEAYTLSDRAIPYYIAEADQALQRGDWREALRMLKRAELCEDGANCIGHALRCLAEKADQTAEAFAREHTERRDCWCEPEITWACDACYTDDVRWPDGRIAGHEHADTCDTCGGTGWVTRANSNYCLVIHDAKDGRP